jgi:hypothetical protein
MPRLIYDGIPPSSNTNKGVGGRGSPYAVARTKKEWEGIFAVLLLQLKVPRGLTWIEVTPTLRFRTKARRDSDNFYFAISKPFGDVCVKMGVIPDDTPEHYGMQRVVIETGCTDLRPGIKGQTILDLAFDHPAQGAST